MRHILIMLLLTAATAHAENWQQLAKHDRNGSAVFVDAVAPDVRSYRWELKLGHFNCADRTAANSQSTLYSADNQAVGNIAVDPSSLKFRRVGPKTAGNVL